MRIVRNHVKSCEIMRNEINWNCFYYEFTSSLPRNVNSNGLVVHNYQREIFDFCKLGREKERKKEERSAEQ